MPDRETPTRSVGVGEIDAQHDELHRRAERLLQALRAEAAGLGELAAQLRAYALTHFGLEESWMRDAHYPGLVRHKLEHDRFLADLATLERELVRDGPVALRRPEVIGWLGAWLTDHLDGADVDLGNFLNRKKG